jgi:hypothetical protein
MRRSRNDQMMAKTTLVARNEYPVEVASSKTIKKKVETDIANVVRATPTSPNCFEIPKPPNGKVNRLSNIHGWKDQP